MEVKGKVKMIEKEFLKLNLGVIVESIVIKGTLFRVLFEKIRIEVLFGIHDNIIYFSHNTIISLLCTATTSLGSTTIFK